MFLFLIFVFLKKIIQSNIRTFIKIHVIIQYQMSITFSLQQIQKTSNLDANLKSRQYKLNLMADFMRIKCENPKKKQSEIANQIGKSSSTLQRYRNDIDMLSPYKFNPNNTNKRTKKASKPNFDNDSHHEPDVKSFQMTSNDFKPTSNNEPITNKENKLKIGSVHKNIEFNEHYLGEILHNNN